MDLRSATKRRGPQAVDSPTAVEWDTMHHVGRPLHESERQPSRSDPDPLRASGTRVSLKVEDVEVSRKLLEGDRHGAVTDAARVFGPALGRLCFILLGSQAEAEEAAQETLLAAYHGSSTFRGEGSARSWFMSIARRTCAQRLSMRLRRSARLALYCGDPAGKDASELLDQAELDARVRTALGKLSDADREILALRYDGDASLRDVAESLGIDEPAARKRVSRALLRLRHFVKEEAP